MTIRTHSRRDFLRVSATSPALFPFLMPFGTALAAGTRAKNDRPRLGLIGAGGQGSGDAHGASHHGDFLAVCDVDRRHAEKAKKDNRIGKGKADIYEDYRKLLDRKDIDAVIIGTPDHWHTKICIDAMRAGKDVYCEKPLTLTIDEGKKLGQVAKETKCVVQVGTQQRSDHNRVFLLAVAMVRAGPHRQNSQSHRVDRRRPDRRPVSDGESPRRAELGHVAGPDAQGRLPRASLPRRFPLVV